MSEPFRILGLRIQRHGVPHTPQPSGNTGQPGNGGQPGRVSGGLNLGNMFGASFSSPFARSASPQVPQLFSMLQNQWLATTQVAMREQWAAMQQRVYSQWMAMQQAMWRAMFGGADGAGGAGGAPRLTVDQMTVANLTNRAQAGTLLLPGGMPNPALIPIINAGNRDAARAVLGAGGQFQLPNGAGRPAWDPANDGERRQLYRFLAAYAQAVATQYPPGADRVAVNALSARYLALAPA